MVRNMNIIEAREQLKMATAICAAFSSEGMAELRQAALPTHEAEPDEIKVTSAQQLMDALGGNHG